MAEPLVIDQKALEKLKKLGGETFLDKMILLFHENSNHKLAEAFDGWEAGDLKQVERAVHSLISTAGNMGAVKMMTLAVQAEKEAGKGNRESFPKLLESLKSAYEEVANQLAEEKGLSR